MQTNYGPLPPGGQVTYTPDGLVVCHVCGKPVHKIDSHIRKAHGMLTEDYLHDYGLMHSAVLCSAQYREKMRRHALKSRTFDANFKEVTHDGPKAYRGGREKNSWSEQERRVRRPAQIANCMKQKRFIKL